MKNKLTSLILTLSLALCAFALPVTAQQPVQQTNKGGVALRTAIVTKTTAYTVREDDHTILVDATAAAVTISLPPMTRGREYFVKKIDSTTNAVTVDGYASETIDGATTQTILAQYGVLHIKGDTTVNSGKWWRINTGKATMAEASTTVDLTADDQAVAPGYGTRIQLTSDNATAANRTFTLSATGAIRGQIYVLIGPATNQCEIAVSGIQKLSATWSPTALDTLTLLFDGTNFIELARSNN